MISPFVIIAFVIMAYAFRDFKKAFMFFAGFRLFLNQNINFNLGSSLPLLTVDFVMMFFFIILYFYKRKKMQLDYDDLFLKKPLKVIVFSEVMSMVFALGGPFVNLFYSLTVIFDFVFLLIFYRLLDNHNVKFLAHILLFASLIVSVYGLYEKSIEFNPIAIWEYLHGGNKALTWAFDYSNDIRGYRISSFFLHPIGAGADFALLALFLLVCAYKLNNIKYPYVYIFISLILATCSIFCNSRGPIIILFVGFIPFVNFHKRVQTFVFSLILIYVICFSNILQNYTDMLLSIFDVENKRGFSGSDLSMRIDQFKSAIEVFIQHPFFGCGGKVLTYLDNVRLRNGLMGLESIWLTLMVQKGLFGVIAFIYLQLSLLKRARTSGNFYTISFIVIAFLVSNSTTTLPGSHTFLYYIIVFVLIKSKDLNNNPVKEIVYAKRNIGCNSFI